VRNRTHLAAHATTVSLQVEHFKPDLTLAEQDGTNDSNTLGLNCSSICRVVNIVPRDSRTASNLFRERSPLSRFLKILFMIPTGSKM